MKEKHGREMADMTNSFSSQISELTSERDGLLEEIETLEEQEQARDELVQQLEQELSDSTARRESAEHTAATLREDALRLESEVEELQSRLGEAEKERSRAGEDAVSRSKQAQRETRALRERVGELERERDGLLEEVSFLKKHLSDVRASSLQKDQQSIPIYRLESWITLLETCLGSSMSHSFIRGDPRQEEEDDEEGEEDEDAEGKLGGLLVRIVEGWRTMERQISRDRSSQSMQMYLSPQADDLRGIRSDLSQVLRLYQRELGELRNENKELWSLLSSYLQD